MVEFSRILHFKVSMLRSNKHHQENMLLILLVYLYMSMLCWLFLLNVDRCFLSCSYQDKCVSLVASFRASFLYFIERVFIRLHFTQQSKDKIRQIAKCASSFKKTVSYLFSFEFRDFFPR